MSSDHLHVWVGLAGDFLTFLGGAILALDAINEDRKAQMIRRIARAIEGPGFKKLTIEIAGMPVRAEDDVEAAFIRRSSRIAKYGFVVLSFGFLFLIAYRVIELCH